MIGMGQTKRMRDDETENYSSSFIQQHQHQQQRKRRSSNHKSSLITSSVHDFMLKSYTGQHGVVDLHLSKILAEFRCVVLFCYAHDFTLQAEKDLRSIEEYAQTFIHKYQTAPLALSTDHVQIHHAFACSPNGLKFKPSFPMVSDHVRLITNHLGILDQERGCPKRTIFIIDSMRNVYDIIRLQGDEAFPMATVITKVASCTSNSVPIQF